MIPSMLFFSFTNTLVYCLNLATKFVRIYIYGPFKLNNAMLAPLVKDCCRYYKAWWVGMPDVEHFG
jgi:hypothetical protein